MDPWLGMDPWRNFRGMSQGGLRPPPPSTGDASSRASGVFGQGHSGLAQPAFSGMQSQPRVPGNTSLGTPGTTPSAAGNFATSSSPVATPGMSPTPQMSHAASFSGSFSQPFSFAPNPQGTTGLGMGAPPTFGVEPQRGHVAHTAPNLGAGAPVTGPLNAANLWHQLDATAAPPSAPSISSAFEMLGKPVHRPAATTVDPQETMMKALTAALSGDRKNLPSWSGDIATLRPWLRQLMLWEVDNNVPKHKWGLKLMQAFGEQSPPRRIAETIDLAILTSESGYSAILSAIMVKYGPYLEAAGPASIETFFYGTERNRNENLSTYIAAKEVALQELESHLGEKLPSRIAGRILLKHANLSDAQKEAMAVRYNALLSFGQAAAALRPLDRPDALVQKVTKTYLTAQDYGGDEDDEEEELLPADAEEPEDEEGPESDGQGNMTFLMFDPQEEYTEEEATYIWAYNSACKDVRRELQARRKGRQFFKKGNTPPVQKKGKNKGFQRRGFGKGRNSAGGAGRGRGQARGAPDELLARTKCFSCGGLGHMSRDCPHQETPQTFFAHSGSSSQSRIYAVNVKAEVQRQLDVFAGARTDDCEGVVDTAAEEAIIGSSAMSRLRAALAKFGLQPIPAEGTTATCAGIGGSATICGVFDVPVGIARTNGLLRVTEIADAGAFETPFLLPISYIELVGGVIDTGKNTFSIRGGKKTPMRRLPSGHRTISVLEFNGKWRLPEQLAKELTSSSSTNPFSLPKANSGEKLQQRPGVAVWLKRGDDLVYMGSLSSRTTLVHPHEVLPKHLHQDLSRDRTTCAHFMNHDSITIHDSWQLPTQRQLPFWSGDVFFELFSPPSAPISPSLTPLSTAQAASSVVAASALQVPEPKSESDRAPLTLRESSFGSARVFEKREKPCFAVESDGVHRSFAQPDGRAALAPGSSPPQLSEGRNADSHHSMAGAGGSGSAHCRATQDQLTEADGRLEAHDSAHHDHDFQHHQAVSHGSLAQPQQAVPGGDRFAHRGGEQVQEDHRRWQGAPRNWSSTAAIQRLQDMALRAVQMCPRRGQAQAAGHKGHL